MFQHTAARRRLDSNEREQIWQSLFQHTAARRRLDKPIPPANGDLPVSTHSRAKAADPKRAWTKSLGIVFQHTAARRRLRMMVSVQVRLIGQPPSRGCVLKRIIKRCLVSINLPAAFARLCVETLLLVDARWQFCPSPFARGS